MKKFFWWLVINGGFASAVWFGFVGGVEGAQNLAKFWVWAVSVPIAFAVLFDEVQKSMAKEPPMPARSAVQHIIAWGALGSFIWFGHIATAVAWGFWMLSNAVARNGVKKYRDAASAEAGSA